MRTMAIKRIIVLFALFAQTLSAPSGCIESCNFYETSYQSHHTSGGYQDHAGLQLASTNLNDHDYAKPGNWTEHNQYNTDGGHGKVHEERGQYLEGSKRVRYYKKNFTSSYGTGNVNGVDAAELRGSNGDQRRYDSIHVPSNQQHYDAQNTYDRTGQTVTKESGYNRAHSQFSQTSTRMIDAQNEKLEDFGEYGGYSRIHQRIPIGVDEQTIDARQHRVETTPENWSRQDTYRTDDGHGRVFEEEGQYVTGPKKVRYYKKNYTSSYGTSGAPQTNVGDATTLNELHDELQKNLRKELDSFQREFHQASSVGHTAHVGTAMGLVNQESQQIGFRGNDLQTAESDNYGQRQQLGYRRQPSTDVAHHYSEQERRESYTDTRQQLPYAQPTAITDAYGTESQRTYQSHETHVSQGQHVLPSQSVQLSHSGFARVPLQRNDHSTSAYDAHTSGHHHRALDETQRSTSSLVQNQLYAGSNAQRTYNPDSSYVAYPGGHSEQTRRYEEQWSSTTGGHTGGNLQRELIADHAERAHYDRVAYNEQQRDRHLAQGYDSHARTDFNTAYRTSSGQLVTGALDMGHAGHTPGGADCTEETQQYQQETRYHRKYKRDIRRDGDEQRRRTYGDDNFTQQTEGQFEEYGRKSDDQHAEDLMQQSEQFAQQTQESDDMQQTSGKLEFGQQTVDNHHMEDLTQQTQEHDDFGQQSGKLEFGQQTIDNHHMDDLTQQTQESDDMQQTSGKLEFGQQTVDNHHMEDLTQQTQEHDDFGQQSGKLEFGQQTIDNHHMEDSTQQTQEHDDFGQQIGKLEFGQQTINNHHMEDLTQQTQEHDDFGQQSGKLEFGQQTIDNHHMDDLTQQTQESDDMQQTSGKLEFGQQTIDNHHKKDLTQQTQEHDDFGQQSGKLEFGQQTINNHHMEDLTQQTQEHDDFGQQSGKLEFGQQTIDNHHMDDLTQQTQESDDMQQTSGKLEFGQQTLDNHHLEHLTQQTQESDDMQQTSGKLEFGQQTIDNHHMDDLMQQTQISNDMQQTSDKLEFGQQAIDNQHLENLTQQGEQFTQQTEHELEQQTIGDQRSPIVFDGDYTECDDSEYAARNLDFGQQTDKTQQMEQFIQRAQRSDDLTQQTVGRLEFGQQAVGNQHMEDFTGLSEQFKQQTHSDDDFTQQTTGNLEFGQQTQSMGKPAKLKNQDSEEFKNEKVIQPAKEFDDFTQQTGRFNHFTQQMGQLEFGRQMQQPYGTDKPGFGEHDIFAQQISSPEYGRENEQQQNPSWPNYNAQRLEHSSQQNNWNADDLSQQSYQYPFYYNKNEQPSEWQWKQMSRETDHDRDFARRTDQQLATGMPKPASKPKPRQRHYDFVPDTDVGTDTNIDDFFNPIEVNPEADIDNFQERDAKHIDGLTRPKSPSIPHVQNHGSGVFDNENENMDRLHWVHKSNDATVGLQWHYTYHPSDLTNIEGSHNNYYPHHNVDSMSQQTEDTQQLSTSFDVDHRDTQDTFESTPPNAHVSQSRTHDSEEIPARVIPLQQNQNLQRSSELDEQSTTQTDVEQTTQYKIESRILEAFGGGPYDKSRNDDIYKRVTPNPKATLPPIYFEDPWDVREKPREVMRPREFTVENTPRIMTVPVTETTTQMILPQTTTEEAPPSFWSRLGHKITRTYDKAKERAKEIFG